MKAKLGYEEFVRLAVGKLRLENYKGIHSVFSGFNEAFKTYFEGTNPIEVTGELARQGKINLAGQGRGYALSAGGRPPA